MEDRQDRPSSAVATVLNLALQICANLAVAFEPFLPFASASIASMLRLDRLSWDMIGTFDLVPAGIEIATPQLLFEKIDDSVIAAQLKKLDDIKRANQLKGFKAEPQAPDVDFDTFVESRHTRRHRQECVKVPKADKLLRFTVTTARRTHHSQRHRQALRARGSGGQAGVLHRQPAAAQTQRHRKPGHDTLGRKRRRQPRRDRPDRTGGSRSTSEINRMEQNRPRILLIYTGGTIGMIENPTTLTRQAV